MRVALVDGGSFVLPYDYQLAETLSAQGIEVEFHGSRTRYNGELLEAMRRLPGVTVHDRALSRTVAPRWQGALGYLALWLGLWWRRRRFDAINLQFSAGWPLELPFLWALRRRLVFTVHNAVPHGFTGRAPRADRADRPAGADPGLRQPVLARRLHRPLRRGLSRQVEAPGHRPHAGRARAAAGAVPAGAAARGAGLLEHGQAVQGRRAVRRAGALRRVLRDAGIGLEIHGAWAPELAGLKAELAGLGVRIEDGFLDAPRLLQLLARNVVFLLPYREATQSGALFSLLHHGCVFLCTDVGDLGDFLRRFGLEALLLRERSADAVVDALERLQRDPAAIAAALQAAQDASAWATTNAGIAAVYAGEG